MKFILALLTTLVLATPAHAELTTLVSATSIGASFNSSVYTVKKPSAIAAQVTVASCSSCNGTLALQASNAETPASTDWTTVDSMSLTANGSNMWNIINPGYTKMRFAYTRTAGSGNVTVILSTKENN